MTHRVSLTSAAREDLREIYRYIARTDDPAKAAQVVEALRKVVKALATFPARGPHPPELIEMGNSDFRELFFKPYRVIYEVTGKTVQVHLITDGRRDMRSLLQRRLLGS